MGKGPVLTGVVWLLTFTPILWTPIIFILFFWDKEGYGFF